MNRGLLTIVLIGCALAVWVLLPRIWRGCDAGSRDPSLAGMPDGAPADPSGGRRLPANPRSGAGAPGERRSTRSGGAPPRRVPPVVGDGDGEPRSGFGRREGRVAPDTVRGPAAPSLSGRDLPEAGSPGTQTAAGELAGEDHIIPEIVYEGGPEQVFDTGAQAEIADAGPISGEAGTVSFWVTPEWQANNQDDATFVQFGDSGLQVTKNVTFLRFEYIDGVTGAEYGVGTDISAWQTGDQRHVVATWTGSSLALYVDGKLVSENRFPRPPDFQQETKLYVGSSFPSGAPVALGALSHLSVWNRGTSTSEVQRLFEAGGPARR